MATLWSTSELHTAGRGRYFWSPLAQGPVPRSWEQAAATRLAAGLEVGSDRALLHTCSLGLQDVYLRQVAGAVYFCSHIAPLVSLTPERLTTDWDAWAATIAFGAPVGPSTPFVEVRRLEAAHAVEASLEGIRDIVFVPDFLARSATQPQPADIAKIVASKLPRTRRRASSPSTVTLSGGWDSRLLAAIAARKSRRPVDAWTTSPDDGWDDDLHLSVDVASALGMRHRFVVPGPESWVESRTYAYRRFQHQTWLHTWLVPLARTLHGESISLLDGLGGDVLMKSLYVDDAVVGASTRAAGHELLFAKLTGGRAKDTNFLDESAQSWIRESARSTYETASLPSRGHLNEYTLSVFANRTARAIAVSPLSLFAPECRVSLPFVDPEVLHAALNVDIRAKLGGGFYRAVLEAAGGSRLALLPSTNDHQAPRSRGFRRQTSDLALRSMAGSVLDDPLVASLLSPSGHQLLSSPDRHRSLCRGTRKLQLTQALTMFADWRETYAGRLTDERAPWV